MILVSDYDKAFRRKSTLALALMIFLALQGQWTCDQGTDKHEVHPHTTITVAYADSDVTVYIEARGPPALLRTTSETDIYIARHGISGQHHRAINAAPALYILIQ